MLSLGQSLYVLNIRRKVLTEGFAPGTLCNEVFTVLNRRSAHEATVQFVRTLLQYQGLTGSPVLSLITSALAGSDQHHLFCSNFTVKISCRQTC